MRPRTVWLSLVALAAIGCGGAATSAATRPASSTTSPTATPARLEPPLGFQHRLGVDHPLVGRVYSRAARAFVDPRDLLRAAERAQVLLLGETHDNADHHALQAIVLRAFLAGHRGAPVALEMLDETQAAALATQARDASALGRAVRWDESGWPPLAIYEPVIAAALELGSPIVAASPSRDHVMAAMHGIAPAERAEFRLDPPLDPAEARELTREIEEGHCGHAMGPMVAAMVEAQSFKDAWMARAVAGARGPAALIAGRGHARDDRGVPHFLRRWNVSSIVTVAFADVATGETDPRAYESEVFDFVVFTPRVTDLSACERFRLELQHMRR